MRCIASIKTAARPKQTIKIFLVVSDIVFTPRAKNHIPPAQNCTVHHKAMNLDHPLERLGSGGTIIVRQTGRFGAKLRSHPNG
jgi:hypothetical protein